MFDNPPPGDGDDGLQTKGVEAVETCLQDRHIFDVMGGMKKAIIAAIISVLVGCAGYCAWLSHRHTEQKFMIAALQARQEKRLKCVIVVQTGSGRSMRRAPKLLPAEYLKQLKEISTDGCPEEFRQAWLQYVQAWERNAAPNDVERRQDRLTMAAVKGKLEVHGGVGTTTGGGLGVEADLSNLKDMAKRLESRDTNESFRHVETVALGYGVDALKWE